MSSGLKCLVMIVGVAISTQASSVTNAVDAFVSGEDGYHTYRIPAIIKLPGTGDLLLFAEGRKLSSADHGWNDIVMKRSMDSGKTWGAMTIVYSESSKNKSVCIGNPSPVALKTATVNGDVILIACRNNKEVIQLFGRDGGTSWSKPTEITNMTVKPNWTWIATGPPQGLQLDSGRILISADHMEPAWGSHTMYSDDGGVTWKLSNDMLGGNECQAARTQNGSLVMNQRTTYGMRQFSWSNDDGATWSTPTSAPFKESGKYAGGTCEGSTISVANNSVLLFSTPFASGRANMTVFSSTDSGATWSWLTNVDKGPSAYSAMVELDATTYGLAYETKNYGAITFVSLPIPTNALVINA
eukprot:m.28391 g.28391  ORF g.28391 m.28391 type:complete len:356 (+) comp15909_c0_seq1:117-1184(+)